MNGLDAGLLTAVGVLAGIAGLLYLMTALDTTIKPRQDPSHRAPRTTLQQRMTLRAPATPMQPIGMTEPSNPAVE